MNVIKEILYSILVFACMKKQKFYVASSQKCGYVLLVDLWWFWSIINPIEGGTKRARVEKNILHKSRYLKIIQIDIDRFYIETEFENGTVVIKLAYFIYHLQIHLLLFIIIIIYLRHRKNTVKIEKEQSNLDWTRSTKVLHNINNCTQHRWHGYRNFYLYSISTHILRRPCRPVDQIQWRM